MGDAAATAHFSVGSGTKLALESAIALAEYLHTEPTMAAAFRRYEEERRTEVLRLQSAARNSTEWFEEVERYLHLDPVQFNYSLLTRSQRISHENLRQRDKAWLEGAEMWFEAQATGHKPHGRRAPADVHAVPPARDATSRTASSSRRWRNTGRWTARRPTGTSCTRRARQGRRRARRHRDDLRLAGGPHHAGLHRACTRPSTRRPGSASSTSCTPRPTRRSAIQLGHSGPKGSTQLGWEEMDAPLPSGNWEVLAPSPVPWSPRQPGAARDDARRHGPRVRRVRRAPRAWPSAPASTCWSCTTPTATCCRRSSRRSPTGATTTTAARSRTACASRWRCSGPCGRCGRRRSRSRCASPRTTGWAAAASRRPTPSRSRACCKPSGRRHHRRVGRPDLHRGAAGLRPHVPDAVLRPHPQRGRHRHHGGRQHLRARPRQLDPDGRARRPRVSGAPAPGRSLLDAACRRARWATRAPTWPKPYLAGRDQLYRLAARAEHRTESACDGATARTAGMR